MAINLGFLDRSEFNMKEKLAALMNMNRMTSGEDLHDEIKKVLQKLNIPIQKLDGVMYWASSVTRKNSGLSSY